MDRGCRQAARQAVVVRQVAQDRGAVVRQTPCLVQRQWLSRKKTVGRNASAQRLHLYIGTNFTCLTAHKPQEHAQVRGMGCQKCATIGGGCRPHPVWLHLILDMKPNDVVSSSELPFATECPNPPRDNEVMGYLGPKRLCT